MEQEQEVLPTPVEPQEQEKVQTEEPTKSVKNFWERLDEVFNLSKQTNQNLEQILETFPEVQQINQNFHSALFQPERISLCSNDDQQPSSSQTLAPVTGRFLTPSQGHAPSEYFSNFRIRLSRPLRNVKSIQMLSAVIPNATTNIPDTQTFFWWYKLRSVAQANRGVFDLGTNYIPGDIVSYNTNTYACKVENSTTLPSNTTYWTQIILPADTTRPNYYDLNPYHLNYVFLSPTWFFPPDFIANGNQLYFNRTFQDYADLVLALNYCMLQAQGNNNAQNDISFQYDDVLNKIIMIPNPANITAGYYYLPCGYEDPNIPLFMASSATSLQYGINYLGIGTSAPSSFPYTSQSLLNTRLGFTWNGRFPNPFLSSNPWSDSLFLASLYYYLRKSDPYFAGPPPLQFNQNVIIANNYADLVNTSCVRIYADFTLGSTQDSLGSTSPEGTPTTQGLLSIVPVNTNNLGVGFYQNNFDNPLTKIPPNITEIGITMLTDQGTPFYLPNSATVLLELGITYH